MQTLQRKRCQTRTRPQKKACVYGVRVSGATIYAYVGGNPLSFTDPMGLAATSPVPAPAPSMSFAPWAPESQQDICVASNDYSKRKSYCLAFCQYELAMPGRFDNFGPHRACMRRCMGSGGFTM